MCQKQILITFEPGGENYYHETSRGPTTPIQRDEWKRFDLFYLFTFDLMFACLLVWLEICQTVMCLCFVGMLNYVNVFKPINICNIY